MIISIDVGIKNLSVCQMDEQANIQKWDVLDLSMDTPMVMCDHIGKKGTCKHKATHTIAGTQHYCNAHIKKYTHINNFAPEAYYIMVKRKVSQQTLCEINNMFSLVNNTQEQLIQHIYNVCATKIQQKTSASEIDLIYIGRSLSKKLTELIGDFSSIKTILIENQISPIATRMKCIQGMITQYFIEKKVYNIHFVSSLNKLKYYNVPKKTYKERKNSCITVTLDILKNDEYNNKWITTFKTHKKKDDLADSYLQGLWFIQYGSKQIAYS